MLSDLVSMFPARARETAPEAGAVPSEEILMTEIYKARRSIHQMRRMP